MHEAIMNRTAKGYLQFGLGIVVIWAMIYHVCPAIVEAIPAYKAYGDEIDRRGITTSALFYNDVKEAGEAELYIRNTLRFMPRNFDSGK